MSFLPLSKNCFSKKGVQTQLTESQKRELLNSFDESRYPLAFRKYVSEEEQLIVSKVKGARSVLDAGCGDGRIIPILAPLGCEIVAIDISPDFVEMASQSGNQVPNIRVLEMDMTGIEEEFGPKYFDYTLLLFNTLGNVENEVKVFRSLGTVTRRAIFVTVYLKGTVEARKEFYRSIGSPLEERIDSDETFYSKGGMVSKAYSKMDMETLVAKVGLKVKESKVLGGVMLWVELVH